MGWGVKNGRQKRRKTIVSSKLPELGECTSPAPKGKLENKVEDLGDKVVFLKGFQKSNQPQRRRRKFVKGSANVN